MHLQWHRKVIHSNRHDSNNKSAPWDRLQKLQSRRPQRLRRATESNDYISYTFSWRQTETHIQDGPFKDTPAFSEHVQWRCDGLERFRWLVRGSRREIHKEKGTVSYRFSAAAICMFTCSHWIHTHTVSIRSKFSSTEKSRSVCDNNGLAPQVILQTCDISLTYSEQTWHSCVVMTVIK